ncbi:MAG TPA: TIGR03088 family PEP-CTERM/XrtA system glycosyltransferase [Burkholderiaceae bacterium]|nr:TIGR03088 family PEP-CTERM/XrtA system glycosyltransferase [Burkholderiaceae bacterium]
MVNRSESRPLIAHVIHHLVTGGLENGLVNLINHLPESRYRHAVICMTDYSDFRRRIRRSDVDVVALHKSSGLDVHAQRELYRLFKRMRPAIVHGRNLSALDALLPAALAGVRVRVHGEHGWDESDPSGLNRRFIWLRRLYSPLVSHYVALNGDLEAYLTERVGIRPVRVSRIYNGVDLKRFKADGAGARALLPPEFSDSGLFIAGTVGRLRIVKDHANLARAFVRAVAADAEARRRMRLVIVGDGQCEGEVRRILEQGGVTSLAWFAGDRADVAQLLAAFDLFVLPSLAEGVSNTILEAMATGLPVLATRVGGNPELVDDGMSGRLVPAADDRALASAMLEYMHDPARRAAEGRAGRERVERRFSLERMVAGYDDLYTQLLSRLNPAARGLQAT